MSTAIKTETISFLSDLKLNNDREWFNTNKDRYLAANADFIEFLGGLIKQVAKFDSSVAEINPKDCVFRIYRDTRFSKDKTPYKTNLGASIKGNKNSMGTPGYYIHLEPGECFLAGGAYMAEPAQLKAFRQELVYNAEGFNKIISNKTFKQTFELLGEKLKNVPPGYNKEDPMAEYLKHKSMWVRHKVNMEDVQSADFAVYAAKVFKTMVPFNSFLTEAMHIGS